MECTSDEPSEVFLIEEAAPWEMTMSLEAGMPVFDELA
jgi:hypothetical protein